MNINEFKTDVDNLMESILDELRAGNNKKAQSMSKNLLNYIKYLDSKKSDIEKLSKSIDRKIQEKSEETKKKSSIEEKLRQIEAMEAQAKTQAEISDRAYLEAIAKAKAEKLVKNQLETETKAEEDARKSADKVTAETEAKAIAEDEAKTAIKAEAEKAVADRLAEDYANAAAKAKDSADAEVKTAQLEIERLKAEMLKLEKEKAKIGAKAKPESFDKEEAESRKGVFDKKNPFNLDNHGLFDDSDSKRIKIKPNSKTKPKFKWPNFGILKDIDRRFKKK